MKTYNLNFFKACKSLEEIKSLYKSLAKLHHPDLGGDVEIMKAVNNEYSIACKLVAKNEFKTTEDFEKAILETEAYKNAIDAIISLEGLIIECVGNWVWVTGNTYEHKTTLKTANFMFASKKKAWYFRSEEFKVKNIKANLSLDQIKTKYGSQLISKSNHNYLHN